MELCVFGMLRRTAAYRFGGPSSLATPVKLYQMKVLVGCNGCTVRLLDLKVEGMVLVLGACATWDKHQVEKAIRFRKLQTMRCLTAIKGLEGAELCMTDENESDPTNEAFHVLQAISTVLASMYFLVAAGHAAPPCHHRSLEHLIDWIVISSVGSGQFALVPCSLPAIV
eukprot:gnl/TRDRNA2_/TRDRNA2_170373_c0_seq4.p2 gnl/TRDRNA2_/TRDRNA2_170373_c0~~gnl/TRDRNA2_/TRDRNA2_170373_c0_seq4.p2  ORF type:complete len:169 (-),score=19.69 gnl/TRDRNA2_/TRDRNA2_170373_c0_seq4:306-812(-)